MEENDQGWNRSFAAHVRKMSDERLVGYIGKLKDMSYEDGYKAGKEKPVRSDTGKTVLSFIEELSYGDCKGVKSSTVRKILDFAKERGFVQ